MKYKIDLIMNNLPTHLEYLKALKGDELRDAIKKEYNKECVNFIMTQTNYDEETASKKLEELKNPSHVVRDYLGIVPKPEMQKSINQHKYEQIRKFMDFGARQYERAKQSKEGSSNTHSN
jgi:hypothetical protein